MRSVSHTALQSNIMHDDKDPDTRLWAAGPRHAPSKTRAAATHALGAAAFLFVSLLGGRGHQGAKLPPTCRMWTFMHSVPSLFGPTALTHPCFLHVRPHMQVSTAGNSQSSG